MTRPTPPHIIRLNVVIVGGGIGGLAAAYTLGRSGHHITIIEQGPWLEEVGAGIQLAPNASKLLVRWGMGPDLERSGVRHDSASFNRFEDDEQIGFSYIGEHVKTEYGAPYYHIHRVDLVRSMYEIGKAYTTTIRRDRVVEVLSGEGLSQSPSVVLQSGEVITSDIIIGADGVKSIVRGCAIDGGDTALPTGDMAFRATIPSNLLEHDQDLRSLIEKAQVTCWMGPGRHIVGYFMKNRELYNLVMVRPDTEAEESWTATATNEEVQESFEGWSRRVRKLTGLVDCAKKSRLVVRTPLSTWVDKSGRIALLGDSCHSMLPYLAQGAAMAIEDAAVLGRLFSYISDKSQIVDLLKGYEELRKPRANATQQASQANQGRYHLPDGPLQQARDAAMKEVMLYNVSQLDCKAKTEYPSTVWNHNKQLAARQFGYDAEMEADEWLRSHKDPSFGKNVGL